jgi:hypothetical protein
MGLFSFHESQDDDQKQQQEQQQELLELYLSGVLELTEEELEQLANINFSGDEFFFGE